MINFSIGDRVTIRHGQHKGQLAAIVAVQPAKVYEVKFSDGSFLCYSSGGLEAEVAVGLSPNGRNVVSTHQGVLEN